ncbi:MAG: hypothetical protein QNK05_17555 [Myxococcota bacterium]|nr:hypothetical protein [Myxococcota bacterium]
MLSRGRPRLCLLLLALVALPAMQCGPRLSLDAPGEAQLLDEAPVLVTGEVAKAFQPASVELRLDGVDLIAALGLVPPFTGAGGVVNVGGQLVTVSGFDFDPTPPGVTPLLVDLDGLDPGDHTLELVAQRAGTAPTSVLRSFGVVAAFQQPATTLDSGAPAASLSLGSEGSVSGASLGQPLAGPPVSLSLGSEVRPGFVPVREELITGATP